MVCNAPLLALQGSYSHAARAADESTEADVFRLRYIVSGIKVTVYFQFGVDLHFISFVKADSIIIYIGIRFFILKFLI